ncbi:hypothetical protein LX16_4294 [Stackebrandtia albiflava]|uniref:Uncharacterized protein n=1 Tax=Stackebrandtia albiflava TaxID=406432 RepID=A0A562UR40_9ACTN|nr:DUF6236 family protein [Stackebrandtia albiflava]TWJ08074.1 hypothetical protein LX16_4294 [Stackebrandtia albiflava]
MENGPNGRCDIRIGLYYPYTHFRDPDWLKLAALYWPRMARVVIPDMPLVDDDTTRTLSDDLDFVLNVTPTSAMEAATTITAETVEAFRDYLHERYAIPLDRSGSIATSGGTYHGVYREFVTVGGGASSMHIRWPGPSVDAVPQTWFDRLVGLHDAKVTRRLRTVLLDSGIAVPSGRWLVMHPNIAWAYMCVLTEQLALSNRLSPVTDEPLAHVSAHNWNAERLAALLLDDPLPEPDPSPDRSAVVAQLALRLVVPERLSAVPASRIVKVRRRHAAEFDAFTTLVEQTTTELADRLTGVSDPEVLRAYLSTEVERRFGQPLEDLRRALRGLGVDAALNTTAVRFEVPAAAATAAGGWAAGEPVLAAAGAVLGLVAVRRSAVRARREAVRASPAGYLLQTERTLGLRSTLDLLRRRGGRPLRH